MDLSPFFNDYDEVAERVKEQADRSLKGNACGLDNVHCCTTPHPAFPGRGRASDPFHQPVLGSESRVALIERAVEVARAERRAVKDIGAEGENTEYCLSESGAVCPLLENGTCLLFDYRPFQCRTYGMDQSEGGRLWGELLTPALEKISAEIWFAYTGSMVKDGLPLFSLPDVVSGKFMETIFKIMMQQGLGGIA